MRRTSIRTQARLALRVVKQRLGVPAFLFATVFVTDRCNVRCDGCVFFDALHTSPAARAEDTASVLRILDALARDGVPVVSYAGGEPFLRADLPAILEAGAGRGFSQLVVTNGLVEAPAIAAACDAFCDAVVFSPHPPSELGHRGANAKWEASWEGFSRLRKALTRAELTVGVTLGRHTAPVLDDIIGRAVRIGVDRVRCHPNFYPSQFPSPAELVEVRRVLESWTAREPERMDDPSLFLDELESFFGPAPRIACGAKRKYNVGIFLDGSVSACCAERVIIGNVFETELGRMHARDDQLRADCYGCHRTDVRMADSYCGA